MRKNTITLPTNSPENLNQPPHILAQFIAQALGKERFSIAQQQEGWRHLIECIDCQAFLEYYLSEFIKHSQEQEELEEIARELLRRLLYLTHKTLAETIPAYTDLLVETDKQQADQRFPVFAIHLHICQDCQLAVHDLQSWLTQLE